MEFDGDGEACVEGVCTAGRYLHKFIYKQEIEQLESFNTLKILKGLDMLEKWRIWKNEF